MGVKTVDRVSLIVQRYRVRERVNKCREGFNISKTTKAKKFSFRSCLDFPRKFNIFPCENHPAEGLKEKLWIIYFDQVAFSVPLFICVW